MCFVVVAALCSVSLFAQTLQDGKRLLLHHRYHAAQKSFEHLVAASPADAEALYWLSQAHFENKDPKGAKDVLQKGMQGSLGSNPLLLVAMGQAELAEKKTNDARQRFETAVSLSKGKNSDVFVAIGKANLEEGGDVAYGIEKLNQATQIKGFKNAMAYVYMGDLHRKIMDGGGAVSAYEKALMIDPKLAVAKHKIGKIYVTQGNEQRDIFLSKFEGAVEDDATFVPALYDLYVYYFYRDVNKATHYFGLYKQHAEPGPALDYEEASLRFAAADFKNAIDKADNLLQTQGDKADARLYRLKGYSYDKLGDSVKALELMETFFQKANTEQINPDNYVVAAYNASKLKTDPAKVDYFFTKAIESDTSISNKVDLTRKAANFFKTSGNTVKSSEWLTKVVAVNPKLSKVDLYNAGFENFKATEYNRADSLFSVYKTSFPDEVYGHYWCFRSLSVVDSTMELGMAVPDCEKFISIAEVDRAKNKSTLMTAFGYMASYSANVKKDFTSAIAYLNKMIEIDPSNQDALKNKEILEKALASQKK